MTLEPITESEMSFPDAFVLEYKTATSILISPRNL